MDLKKIEKKIEDADSAYNAMKHWGKYFNEIVNETKKELRKVEISHNKGIKDDRVNYGYTSVKTKQAYYWDQSRYYNKMYGLINKAIKILKKKYKELNKSGDRF